MGATSTVSAKIPRELREKLRKLNINVSRFVREALEKEVKRREEVRLRERARETSLLLKKISPKEIVKLIRETREER